MMQYIGTASQNIAQRQQQCLRTIGMFYDINDRTFRKKIHVCIVVDYVTV